MLAAVHAALPSLVPFDADLPTLRRTTRPADDGGPSVDFPMASETIVPVLTKVELHCV